MVDYVIVGAGSAGCVLAARLTEDPAVSVLLLEAGPPDDAAAIDIPVQWPRLQRTERDWDLATQPERDLQRRRIALPRGRTLGGSSSLNAMLYVRGNPADYDGWGVPGWGFADLLPAFKRAEDNERGAGPWHGAGGPLGVSDGRSRNRLAAAFLDAATQAGLARNTDFNGAAQDGAGWYQVTQRDGRRCSAAAAYLRPARGRANLAVRTGARVRRVIFDGTRAAGVEGAGFVARARREVVLCAGAYHSPQLLMLSGVGDAAALAREGIACVCDLPQVGMNLADHLAAGAVWAIDEPLSLTAAFRARGGGGEELASPLAEAGAFDRTRPDLRAPDLQLHCVPAPFADGEVGVVAEHGLTLTVCLLTPGSRGRVTLASAEPTAKPRIEHRYLSTRSDVQRTVAGLRRLLEIAAQPALARFTRTPIGVPPAGASDDALLAYIRATAQSLYHPVGTCALGSVVDARLRVRGVTGLRVVDASVIPAPPRGNTNAPTIAVAERAADLLRGDVRAPVAGQRREWRRTAAISVVGAPDRR